MSKANHAKRQVRKKATAEEFTPAPLVREMLNKLPKEVWEENKTFCDNSCGNGNFLVAVLDRKLKVGHDSLIALATIYGADIMLDNIDECRRRLIKMVLSDITVAHVVQVVKNIVWINQEKYPKGSLDFDFEFKHYAPKHVKMYVSWINAKFGKNLELKPT